MKKRTNIKRALPNLLTMGNLFSGFLAINETINGDIKSATILIFIAIMLDAMDGRVARVLGVPGEFGKQLDSLADIVSFGVAPAFMASYVYFDGSMWGVALCGLFPLFGAYRLARFNLTPSTKSLKHFEGIPITLAGAIVAFLTLFEKDISSLLFGVVYVALALLMVSTVKIPSYKKMELPRNAVITTIFIFYMVYLFVGVRPEEVPVTFYLALATYIGFIVVRFFKEKEPSVRFTRYKFKKPFKIRIRKKVG